MKKMLFLLVTLCLFGCQSREERKISELIKDDMFKTLYDFESYEPIETSKADSAFTTIYKDSSITAKAIMILLAREEISKWLEDSQEHVKELEIWGDSYTAMARYKVDNAKEKLADIIRKSEIAQSTINMLKETIKNECENFESNFIGWSVKHKYRCKTKGGAYDIGETYYVFDPQLDKVLYTETDEVREGYEKIKSVIDEALK